MDNKNTGWIPFFAGLLYGLFLGLLVATIVADRKIDKAIMKQNEDWIEFMQKINDSYKLDLPQPDTVTIVRIDTLFKEVNEAILQPESCTTTVVFLRKIEIQ